MGLCCGLGSRARSGLVALCAAIVAVVAAVMTIAAVQLQNGRWPIVDAGAVAQYGTSAQAALRAAVILGLLVGAPCLITAGMVTIARRRFRREAAPRLGEAADAPQGTRGR